MTSLEPSEPQSRCSQHERQQAQAAQTTQAQRVRRSTSARVALLAALSFVLAGFAIPAANAAPSDGSDGPAGHLQGQAVSAQEAQAAQAYWTPARMKNARSADVLTRNPAKWRLNASGLGVGPSGQALSVGIPQVVPGQEPVAAAPESAEPNAKPEPIRNAASENTVPNIGKVFFKISGQDYVCSGNVVSANNRSTVSTAGHCVNEGPGKYYTDFVFVPAYDNGNAPYGKWPAQTLNATSQWVNNGDMNYDTAFVKLQPLNGRAVQDVVGSSGVAFNQQRGLTYKSYGYPAASPYNGQTLKSCYGKAHDDPNGGSTQGIPCDMTGGSSGGPWFIGTNPRGSQNSLNSYSYNNDPNTMYGPYWGTTIQSLYNKVQAS